MMSNKRTLKFRDIVVFLKDGLMKKEKMTGKQADEFLNRVPTETIIELYSKILEDVFKKRGKKHEQNK